MAEIWGAVAAAAVVVGGSAVIANNNQPDAPGQRNLSGELSALGSQYPQTLDQLLQGSMGYNQNSLNNLGSLATGQFDVNKFFADNNEARAGWDAHFTNGENQGWTPEQYARAFLGGDNPDAANLAKYNSYKTGSLPQLAAQLNTSSRTSNLADAQALGQQYVDLTRGANQDYYNSLNAYTAASQQPVTQSASQQQAAQMAAQGYGSFDPSGLQAHAQNVTAQQGSPLLDQLNRQAMSAGPSGLQQQQNALATQLLNQGGNLSASDLRNVQQNSLAGFAARGLDATNASVADEVLQTDAAQRARLVQNLGIAQGVQNQGLAEQNQQNQFGLGVSNQNYGYGQLGLQAQQSNQSANLQAQLANQNFGLGAFNSNLQSQTAQQTALNQSAALAEQQRQAQLQAQAQAVQLQRQGYLDPFAAITGSADQNLFGQLLSTNQNNLGTQANLYGSLLGYGQDLNNTNYNANAASNIASNNADQALYGSLIQAGGNVASSYYANK